ncbi:MAG: DUF4346 domain-containing protein [Gammaproteobacteria bacterium]
MSKAEDFGFFLTRTFASTKKRGRHWPFVPGKYFVLDQSAPVAVTTLGSVDLAAEVFAAKPAGMCIVGKVETENIGIEKIIKNIISNKAIKYLVCAGKEPPKHMTGATMVALFENGVDERNKIIGSPGMRPILPNTSAEEIAEFREQVTPVDMVGEASVEKIAARVRELAATVDGVETEIIIPDDDAAPYEPEVVIAEGIDPLRVKLDKAGYFVINIEDAKLLVEHYDYKERLVRVIEGVDARSIYFTLINNGWVSRLDHAAYLGKQLAKAELSIQHGFEFVQDGG